MPNSMLTNKFTRPKLLVKLIDRYKPEIYTLNLDKKRQVAVEATFAYMRATSDPKNFYSVEADSLWQDMQSAAVEAGMPKEDFSSRTRFSANRLLNQLIN